MLLEPYGLEYGMDNFFWRNIYLSVPLLTQYPPCLPQEERYSIGLLRVRLAPFCGSAWRSAWHSPTQTPSIPRRHSRSASRRRRRRAQDGARRRGGGPLVKRPAGTTARHPPRARAQAAAAAAGRGAMPSATAAATAAAAAEAEAAKYKCLISV